MRFFYILLVLVLVRNLSDLFKLVLMRSFSYIPLASFTDELYTSDATFRFLMLDLVRNVSYTPDASFSEEFLLHS